MNFFGIPKFKKYNKGTMRVALNRLQKKDFLEKELQGWVLTPAGKKYIKKKADSLAQFSFNFPKDASKNMIVMFDISEPRKAERGWFRRHLKMGGYIMIQKSVWVGPSPLPKEFLAYLKEIKLESSIKTFKLAKEYKV